MSLRGSADVGFLLADGMNILADMTDIEDEMPDVVEETTPLGAEAQTHAYVGVGDYMLTQKGFYNDAAARSNAALVGPGRTDILSFAPEGNTLGAIVPCSELTKATYKRLITRGALTKAEATYQSSKGHDEARLIHPLGAETANGDGEDDSYDGGAQSSNGGVGYLQVTAITLGGYDDVTIEILDDADDSGTFGNLLSFTDVTAIGAQRVAVAGTVERYLTWKVTFNGTGSNPSITFMVAFARNP